MMLGTCRVERNTIITSKTTYVVTEETRPDVRRVFLIPGMVIGGGLTLFTFGFADLLYAHEFAILGTAIAASIFAATQVAQLTILDRVTRGTEQMSAIYGLHSTLQRVRGEIDAVIFELKGERA